MNNLTDKIIERIKTVFDPEIPVNLYDLGLIYKLDIKPSEGAMGNFDVQIDMTLTTPNCPVAAQMPEMVRKSIIDLPELRTITVTLTFDPPWSKDMMSDAAKLQMNLI